VDAPKQMRNRSNRQGQTPQEQKKQGRKRDRGKEEGNKGNKAGDKEAKRKRDRDSEGEGEREREREGRGEETRRKKKEHEREQGIETNIKTYTTRLMKQRRETKENILSPHQCIALRPHEFIQCFGRSTNTCRCNGVENLFSFALFPPPSFVTSFALSFSFALFSPSCFSFPKT